MSNNTGLSSHHDVCCRENWTSSFFFNRLRSPGVARRRERENERKRGRKSEKENEKKREKESKRERDR